MPAKHTLHVALTEPLKHFVHDQIASGRYATASEVVRAALQALNERGKVSSIANPKDYAARLPRSAQP